MSGLLLALALAAAALPGFPRDAGGRITAPAIGVVVGGAPAVVVPAGEEVLALRGDGSPVPGFRLALGPGEVAAGPAAAADMDGDGRAEIAVVTASGRLLLWSGGLVPGFPVQLGARVRAGVSFGDVDGDGHPELLVGDEQGRVHAFRRNGREVPGWPARLGAPITSTVSSAVFAGGRSFAVGCEDGRVHVLDPEGRPRPGFPLATRFSVSGAPAFADLDDDGEMDLVVASQDFGVYAVDGRGRSLPGFPVRAGYRIYEGVAVADLLGDGHLDVAFASADGFVHAVTARGARLPGFPVRVGTRLFSGPAVGDLDGDGVPELVAVTADGTVSALRADGRPLPGFPVPLAGRPDAAATSPLLYDATGGGPAIFVGLAGGELHGIRAARAGGARSAAAWGGPGHDPARSGRYGPNPPSYRDLALSPSAPRAPDAVHARWRATWLDARPGEAAPAPQVEWLRDGRAVPSFAGAQDLPAGTVRRGERWRFVLTSAAAPGASFRSPEVRVLDSAPGAAVVSLDPPRPSRAGDVRGVLVTPAADPDGDPLSYRWTWLLDGVDTGVQADRFPARLLRRGALLAARVVASDGELTGPPASAQARVADTAPGAPRVSLQPPQPGRADVEVRLDEPATDPDGDPLTYRYRWAVDGRPLSLPLSASRLPGSLFRKHQRIEVEVRAFDGLLEGPPATAVATARDTPPTAPRVEIRPARPRHGEPLRLSIVAPSEDVDGDPIAYRIAWTRNGAPFAGAGADGREVPGAAVARGDRFEVTVIPHDGEVAGPAATAAVTVVNTPPVPPRVAIEPARPAGGDTLRLVVVEPAHDVDGDPVTLAVAWTRDGKPAGGGETLAPDRFRKHERVRVAVTPSDGEASGAPAMAEVVVADAPPTAPAVAFSAERPTATAPLRAVLRAPAVDPDGDAVAYQYRWFRDGEPVALPGGTPSAAPGWAAASEVPATLLRKGQRWTVEVRAHDGELPGPVARASVVIADSPPPAPRLAFAPERPRRNDGLAVRVEQPPDPDGDAVTHRYAWTRDGQRVDVPPEQGQIPRGVPRRGQRWAVEVVASDGEAESPPARLEVVVADTPPGAAAIALCDGPIRAGTAPEVRVIGPAADPDGDPVAYRYAWSVNGAPAPSAQGLARLAAPALRKHDVVRVTVTPWDGELAGPPSHGECEVENTPPAAPQIALVPAEPTAATGIAVAIRRPAADRDGDPVTYRYAWYRDGVVTGYEGASVPPGAVHHRETWRAVVTPFDGEAAGDAATASVAVRNTPPPAPTVALAPAAPATGEPIACVAAAPERDADGEPVALRYRWHRNGASVALGEGLAALPARTIRRGERWRCEAWTTDGTAESGHVFADLVVPDSPPSAPGVVVEPALARRGDALACRVETPARDLDDDPVSYAFAWTRNGRPAPSGPDPARVEGSRVVKGDRWRCTVTASDGTLAGPAASAERVVANTPPGPPEARIQPAIPRAGEPIRCEIAARSEDPDGDAVRYRFAWQRNGVVQPFAASSAEVPARLVREGDRWRCAVTPSDGLEDGPPGASAEIEVSRGVPEPAGRASTAR